MKILSRFCLVVLLLAATMGVASAAFTGPLYDTYVNIGGTNNPTQIVMYVQDSIGACNDSQVAYIQFDASNIGTVTSASLVLTVGATRIGLDTNPTLTLYGVADFDPATLSGSNNPVPATGTVIQNRTIPVGTLQFDQISFGGADTGLAGYIQAQANTDNVVSLALSFSSACNSNNSQINFYTQEYATTPAYRPALTVEGTKPNAVAVTNTSAERVSWPLYTGLGGLALVVVAGVAISRRRTA